MPDGTIDYTVKNINRLLVLLAGYCVHIDDVEVRRKAGEAIAEIQDTDIPKLRKLCQN